MEEKEDWDGKLIREQTEKWKKLVLVSDDDVLVFEYVQALLEKTTVLEQENEQLKQQLAEKEELLKNAILLKPEYGQIVYRIIPNSNSNDFNNEPEYKIVQDIFIGMDANKYVLKNKQFKTLFSQPINKCFLTKEEAQKKLEELI